MLCKIYLVFVPMIATIQSCIIPDKTVSDLLQRETGLNADLADFIMEVLKPFIEDIEHHLRGPPNDE